MNKAVIAACMGLLVVTGCSNKKPAGSDAGMTPPPPPSVVTPAPEPMPMAPPPAPTVVTPAPAPAPAKETHAKAAAPKAAHVAKAERSTGKKVYVVQKGDNMSKIAKHYKTTVAKLMKANPKIKPDGKILVGQKINIP